MARPESNKDVKNRFISVARFEVDKFAATPALLKGYTAFIETAQKMGGKIEAEYGSNYSILMPRNDTQLADQLRTEQYEWDDMQKQFRRALKADESDPVPEWRRDRVKEWCKAEGFPDPFDCFAANDEELQRIRQELGIED